MIRHHPATSEQISSNGDFQKRRFDFPGLSKCSIHEVHILECFPNGGFAKNNICSLAVRLMKGRATLFLRGENGVMEDRLFMKGESFEIPSNIPYYIIAEPSAVLYIVSEPPWNEEQLEIITF